MNTENIKRKLELNRIPYHDDLPEKLRIYHTLLNEWNRRMDLTAVADDEETGDTLTLNEGNDWTDSVDGLPVNKDGVSIQYSVSEPDLPEGYEAEIGDTEETADGYAITITNTHTSDSKQLKVTKVWEDDSDQAGTAP